jgi:hypothetical protein
MYPRIDAPSNFCYPAERLLKLRRIHSADELHALKNGDHRDDRKQYAIKRGVTTIGCLTGFESHVRRY